MSLKFLDISSSTFTTPRPVSGSPRIWSYTAHHPFTATDSTVPPFLKEWQFPISLRPFRSRSLPLAA